MLLPSRRLLIWGFALTACWLAVLAEPAALFVLLACDVVLIAFAILDGLLMPRPAALDVVRLAPERLSVLSEERVTLLIRNRSRLPLYVRLRDGVPETFRADREELSGTVPAQGEARPVRLALPLSALPFAVWLVATAETDRHGWGSARLSEPGVAVPLPSAGADKPAGDAGHPPGAPARQRLGVRVAARLCPG
jgi:hypothetical protein